MIRTLLWAAFILLLAITALGPLAGRGLDACYPYSCQSFD